MIESLLFGNQGVSLAPVVTDVMEKGMEVTEFEDCFNGYPCCPGEVCVEG